MIFCIRKMLQRIEAIFVPIYAEFITGSKFTTHPNGPEEMPVIFVDNGRTEVLTGLTLLSHPL